MDPVKAVVPIVGVGVARRPVRRAKVETDPNIISKARAQSAFMLCHD
jgi:hypothetical protein